MRGASEDVIVLPGVAITARVRTSSNVENANRTNLKHIYGLVHVIQRVYYLSISGEYMFFTELIGIADSQRRPCIVIVCLRVRSWDCVTWASQSRAGGMSCFANQRRLRAHVLENPILWRYTEF